MRNAVITKWDLTPQDKFQTFFSELVVYLRQNLLQVKRIPDSPDSELIWICRENYTNIIKGCGDRNFQLAIYSKRICKMKNFYWPEAWDMIEEELNCMVTSRLS